MATVAFDKFLPEVMLECPTVPDPVAINAIRNACFDFCRDSLWLNELQDAYTYAVGTGVYDLDAPTWAQIVQVLNVNVDEKYVIFSATREQSALSSPAYATTQGRIEWYVQPTHSQIQLVRVPDAAGYFIPLVAYAPKRTATVIDDRMFDLHLETVKYGALWKLKAMAGQPWADPAGAAYNEQRFLMATNAATIDRNKSFSQATLMVQPRGFV